MTDAHRLFDAVEGLREWDSATVSNAIEMLSYRDRTTGFMSSSVRCMFPKLPPMVGYAVTCLIDSSEPGPQRPTKFGVIIDVLEAAPYPTVVVAQHFGVNRERSCFLGDLSASLLQRLGATGAVSDVPSRDIARIQDRAPGFQLFGPGTVASHGNGTFLAVNVPVTIGELLIEPGDLLHGDVDGLVSVPLPVADQVADACQKVHAAEARMFDLLAQAPLPVAELKGQFTH